MTQYFYEIHVVNSQFIRNIYYTFKAYLTGHLRPWNISNIDMYIPEDADGISHTSLWIMFTTLYSHGSVPYIYTYILKSMSYYVAK